MTDIENKMRKLLDLTYRFRDTQRELNQMRDEVLREMDGGKIPYFECEAGRIDLLERTSYNWDITALKEFLGEESYRNIITVKGDNNLAINALRARASDLKQYENAIMKIGNHEKSKFIQVKTPI